MIESLALGLGGSLVDALSPKVSDWLGLSESTEDVVKQQGAAFQQTILPIIQGLMEDSMNKGAYSSAGTQGAANVAEAFKRQQDRYTGTMGPQETAQVNALNEMAQGALSNVGSQSALAQQAFGQQGRAQNRQLSSIAANQGPGAMYSLAQGLGEANQQGQQNLMNTQASNASQALGLAGSLSGKAGELGMQSKQQQQQLFVDPFRRQQENLSHIASTGFSQGFGNVANVNKMKTDPLGGLSRMLMGEGAFGQKQRWMTKMPKTGADSKDYTGGY